MTKILTAPAALAAATLALGVCTAPALAKAANTTARMESDNGAAAPAKKEARPGKVRYCFVGEVTGSRLPQKVCRTKEGWEALGVEVPVK